MTDKETMSWHKTQLCRNNRLRIYSTVSIVFNDPNQSNMLTATLKKFKTKEVTIHIVLILNKDYNIQQGVTSWINSYVLAFHFLNITFAGRQVIGMVKKIGK